MKTIETLKRKLKINVESKNTERGRKKKFKVMKTEAKCTKKNIKEKKIVKHKLVLDQDIILRNLLKLTKNSV